MSSCDGRWLGCTNLTNRQSSPSGSLDLVIEDRDCGATSSVARKVYLTVKNESPAFWDDPILLVDKYDGLNFEWRSEKEIVVHYWDARIHKFKNHWIIFNNGKVTHEVELVLLKSKKN